jgi:iron-sulfur cluster repair protein YtfE (RIC family)
MARDLARAEHPNPAEVRSVAAQIARYFGEALPLHVADEQEQILPRIASWSPDIDRALATMTDDHAAHVAWVERLTAICDSLAEQPGELPRLRAELRQIADDLSTDMSRHLELEERIVFPALRRLSADQKTELLDSMRERRARVLH